MGATNNYTNRFRAYELLATGTDFNGVEGAMSSSAIDLNPHQIQAAMFALNSPISKGAILADEVGLGKTIEAGLVISEYYLRSKNKIIIVCPASLRKQWERELEEKFDIPTRLLDKTQFDYFRAEHKDPLNFTGCIICSYNFAADRKREMHAAGFDLVVVDEAHKLRNLHKGETFIADGLYEAFADTKKLLLTATPIQNSLMDIFSLVSFIDPTIFVNKFAFEENYLRTEQRHRDLQQRLKSVLHRTLRRDVLEYIRYTNREALTIAFDPTPEEQDLYTEISEYIHNSNYGIRTHFRTLIVLMIQKLMASSTNAVKGTLEGVRDRLVNMQKKAQKAFNIANLIADNDLLESYKEEYETEDEFLETFSDHDIAGIDEEIKFLNDLIYKAGKITVDGKTDKLIAGLEEGFARIAEKGGKRKAIIFTESQRTLDYLFEYLSGHGFKNKVVTFSGNNNNARCNAIYEEFKNKNPMAISGVRSADMRLAIIDKFKTDDNAELMIATEAGAEGLNLQFCSMLVNYDLPWNPQRVEQRIGRIHRYGQKHDVVIVNFINKTNAADVRLYNILQNKFKLFDGIFGASDEILGSLYDGVEFERAVSEIFQNCRTEREIEEAFDVLQARLGEQKEEKLRAAEQLVLDNLNPSIAEKLRVIKASADKYIEHQKHSLWELTKAVLGDKYFFNEDLKKFGQIKELVFDLPGAERWKHDFSYRLDFSKKQENLDIFYKTRRERSEARCRQLYAYNPRTKFGKSVIQQGTELPTDEPVHLVSQMNGQKGRGTVRVSVYHRTAPTDAHQLIVTFISDTGSEIQMDAGAFFDGVIRVEPFQDMGYREFLDMFHDKKIKTIVGRDRNKADNMILEAVEKANRWAYEEKNSLKYQIKSLEHKLLNARKKFKAETNIEEKVRIGMDMEEMKNKIADLQFNTFEKQGATDKEAAKMVSQSKRALKYKYELTDIMLCSWEVV